MEQKKTNLVVWSAGSIVVLVAAFGLGMVIRQIREWRAESEQQQPDKPAAKQSELKPQQEAERLVEVVQEPTEPVKEIQPEPEKAAPKDSNEAPKSEPIQERSSMAGRMGDWRQMWSDLNLTEEERARLQEGFRLARERWQNMSEEQRQAEMNRLSAMRERWENMSDEERQAAMERGRQRFEEWRRSDRVELPEMSLD